jgi:hypothetical protein
LFFQSAKEYLLLILKNYREDTASQRDSSKEIITLERFSRDCLPALDAGGDHSIMELQMEKKKQQKFKTL